MVYGCIAKYASVFPVTRMCQWLGVNRASYYRWKQAQTATPGPQAQRRAHVGKRITELHTQWDQRPGRRAMRSLLAAEGETCSLGFVHRLMQEHHLAARRHRRWRTTTQSVPGERRFPNACQTASGMRDFTATQPRERVVSDITMLRTGEGWLYLAIVIDLATRAVVGWAMASHMRASLVVDALTMAWDHDALHAGTIFHSDHGSQYTSTLVHHWCRAHAIQQSMGQTGVCWDNAVAESFFATLKGDLHGQTFADRHRARHWVIRYVEGWYNRVRPHTTHAGLAPLTVWQQMTSRPFGVSLS